MSSLITGYEYDIFISYRHNDNRSGWVTEFVHALQEELAATIKEPLSVYYDTNPHDGLLETHDVDGSLKEKIKCLIFIPIVSQTYCDPKSFAWQSELLPFIKFANHGQFGLVVKLANGNTARRVLPVRIHEIDRQDKKIFEEATGGIMRPIDFVYKNPGVNRPLKKSDDEIREGGKLLYQDQINKVANAIKEIIGAIAGSRESSPNTDPKEVHSELFPTAKSNQKFRTWRSYTPQIPIFKFSIFFALVVLALVALSIFHFSETRPDNQVVRSIIPPPEGTQFVNGFGGKVELSPDGLQMAFVAMDSSETELLWVRSLNQLEAKPIKGTEGASFPFWSPDGKHIGFFADRSLKKVAAAGGPVQVLCSAQNGRGGSWSTQGTIIFCPTITPSALYRVPDSGGIPKPLTQLDSVKGHQSHRWPYFLPDGNHFLYCARTATANSGPDDEIYVGSLDKSFVHKPVLKAGSNVAYANGYLLYAIGNSLMTESFDAAKLQTSGSRATIANDVQYSSLSAKAAFSVSRNGVLAYQRGTAINEAGLTLRRKSGEVVNRINRPGSIFNEVAFSPDESRIAASILDTKTGNTDIWFYEISRNIWTRFTFNPASERWPVWSPDGKHLVYGSSQGEVFSLFIREVSGTSPEKILISADSYLTPYDWSKDGKYLVYEKLSPTNGYDLWILHMTGDNKTFPFFQSEFNGGQGAFSPDGKWIAFRSDESGTGEVYIRPFPGPGAKYQISVNGGRTPKWRKDGLEIYYHQIGDRIGVAEIEPGSNSVKVGDYKWLYNFNVTSGPSTGNFDATSDGQLFIVVEGESEINSPVTLVLNWPEELKKK